MQRFGVVAGRVAIWAFALLVAALSAGLLLLMGAKGASNYLDDFCVEDGRGPRAETAYAPPHLAGPGQWRCEYDNLAGHSSATYTDWFPFVGGALAFVVVLLVAVAPLVAAFAATRRPDPNVQSA